MHALSMIFHNHITYIWIQNYRMIEASTKQRMEHKKILPFVIQQLSSNGHDGKHNWFIHTSFISILCSIHKIHNYNLWLHHIVDIHFHSLVSNVFSFFAVHFSQPHNIAQHAQSYTNKKRKKKSRHFFALISYHSENYFQIV